MVISYLPAGRQAGASRNTEHGIRYTVYGNKERR